jgi:hypothetical protein
MLGTVELCPEEHTVVVAFVEFMLAGVSTVAED